MNTPDNEQFRCWAYSIAADDDRAFDELFRTTYALYTAYACRLLKDRDEAADLVQECFVSLWTMRQQLDPERSLKALLYRMIRNRALNRIRDRKRRAVSLDENPYIAKEYAESPDLPSEGSDRGEAVRQLIEKLPERQREALELSRFVGLTHKEVADVMDVSARTVNNHIVAALQTLRDHFESVQT